MQVVNNRQCVLTHVLKFSTLKDFKEIKTSSLTGSYRKVNIKLKGYKLRCSHNDIQICYINDLLFQLTPEKGEAAQKEMEMMVVVMGMVLNLRRAKTRSVTQVMLVMEKQAPLKMGDIGRQR